MRICKDFLEIFNSEKFFLLQQKTFKLEGPPLHSGTVFITLYFLRNLLIDPTSYSVCFVPVRLSQLSLTFVGKAGAYPRDDCLNDASLSEGLA